MHPLFTAGEAAGEEPLHATCMRSGGQVLPCRRQGLRACRMHPLLMAGDRRRQGTSTGHEARGWHALWLPGAASGAASAHASCIHRCGCRRATGACRLHPLFRAVPAIFTARPQGQPHASLIDGRRCRRRGNRACRLHALRLAGAAAGLASAHAAGIHRGLQGPPPARYQHRPLASIVARRSCRRRGHEACGWHALWLSGAASGAASAHASCIHRCGCRRATGARRLHPLFRAGPAIFKASTFAACIQGGMPQLVRKEVLQAWCAWSAGWGRSTSTIDASGPCPSQREAWP